MVERLTDPTHPLERRSDRCGLGPYSGPPLDPPCDLLVGHAGPHAVVHPDARGGSTGTFTITATGCEREIISALTSAWWAAHERALMFAEVGMTDVAERERRARDAIRVSVKDFRAHEVAAGSMDAAPPAPADARAMETQREGRVVRPNTATQRHAPDGVPGRID